MDSTFAGQNQTQGQGLAVRQIKFLFKGLPNSIINAIGCLTFRQIHLADCPAQYIKLTLINFRDAAILNSYQGGALGPGFLDMPPLDIAWKDNPGIFRNDLTFMDMAQGPVVIAL